ncbi:hypothetical protein E3N88_00027 [Mikania micrantha]|uniref:Uncharacterized protein n=1 Tax=Mikania micrantha TaxID=192012 RepID=A0A5N6PYX5_9ASTR|nr:hypothetical protein E3N88_00027 [Mikania micrantha]
MTGFLFRAISWMNLNLMGTHRFENHWEVKMQQLDYMRFQMISIIRGLVMAVAGWGYWAGLTRNDRYVLGAIVGLVFAFGLLVFRVGTGPTASTVRGFGLKTLDFDHNGGNKIFCFSGNFCTFLSWWLFLIIGYQVSWGVIWTQGTAYEGSSSLGRWNMGSLLEAVCFPHVWCCHMGGWKVDFPSGQVEGMGWVKRCSKLSAFVGQLLVFCWEFDCFYMDCMGDQITLYYGAKGYGYEYVKGADYLLEQLLNCLKGSKEGKARLLMGWKDLGSLWVEDFYVDPTGGQTMRVSWVKRTYHVDFRWGQFRGSFFCFKNIVDFYESQHLNFWWLHLGCCVDSCFGALGTDLCRELYGQWSAALLGLGRPALGSVGAWATCWWPILARLMVLDVAWQSLKWSLAARVGRLWGMQFGLRGLTTDGCSYCPSGAAAMILFSPPVGWFIQALHEVYAKDVKTRMLLHGWALKILGLFYCFSPQYIWDFVDMYT